MPWLQDKKVNGIKYLHIYSPRPHAVIPAQAGIQVVALAEGPELDKDSSEFSVVLAGHSMQFH